MVKLHYPDERNKAPVPFIKNVQRDKKKEKEEEISVSFSSVVYGIEDISPKHGFVKYKKKKEK